ncbi:MAG: glycosyltransferase [Saprospiraceae bacterium]
MTYFFAFVSFFLAIDYAVFILKIRSDWSKKNETTYCQILNFPFVSVIISARNEENNISDCLKSIIATDYPLDKYEILLIDDHSDDNTVALAENLEIQNLVIYKLKNHIKSLQHIHSFKKAALALATKKSKGELLLFTDADVLVLPTWIRAMTSYCENGEFHMITGPIKYASNNSIIQNFQALDTAGTMLWTASGIWSRKTYLANGANMMVRKTIYEQYQHLQGIKMASGDDVFLIQSIAEKYPQKVGFIKTKEAIVTTFPEVSWQNLFEQRLRWASKNQTYSNERLTIRTGMIYIFYLICLTFFFLVLIKKGSLWGIVAILFFIKIAADTWLLKSAIEYFRFSISVVFVPFYALIQMVYIVILGTMSLINSGFEWKGRKF